MSCRVCREGFSPMFVFAVRIADLHHPFAGVRLSGAKYEDTPSCGSLAKLSRRLERDRSTLLKPIRSLRALLQGEMSKLSAAPS